MVITINKFTILLIAFLGNGYLFFPQTQSLMEQKIISEPKEITLHCEQVDEECDPEETIYDVLSEDDTKILFRIVEAECTNCSIEAKMNVANVIINRVNSSDFPDTIEEVVFQKVSGHYQFSPVSDKRYWKVDITEETILACENIFLDKDTTNGSLFFCNKATSKQKYANWMDRNLEYIFTDDANHSFYK